MIKDFDYLVAFYETAIASEDYSRLMDSIINGFKIPGHKWDTDEFECPCDKDVYRTFEAAEKALKQRGRRGERKNIYKCNICGHYHISSKDGRSRRARAYNRNKVDQRGKLEIKRYIDSRSIAEYLGIQKKGLIVRNNCMSAIA